MSDNPVFDKDANDLPDWLKQMAVRLGEWLKEESARERFRAMLKQWVEEHEKNQPAMLPTWPMSLPESYAVLQGQRAYLGNIDKIGNLRFGASSAIPSVTRPMEWRGVVSEGVESWPKLRLLVISV